MLQIVVEIGVDALDRRRVNRFAVKRLAGDFHPDAADDADVVFVKQIDNPVQKTDGVTFDPLAAAHGVAAQVGAFDFRDDAVKEFVRRIVQSGVVTVFQLDEIVRQIVQILVIGENARDRQNGLVVAVGIGFDGQGAQIAGFVNVADFDQDTLRIQLRPPNGDLRICSR